MSAYAGPFPRRVVPIWSVPEPALARLVEGDVPRHDHVRFGGQADDIDGDAAPGEVVELVDEDRRVDYAPGADDALLAPEDPGGHVLELVRLAVGDDRVAGTGPAVVAADDVRVAGEQVDDLALALVSPLRADDHRRGHAGSLTAERRCYACWLRTASA